MSAPWFHVENLPPLGAPWHLARDEAKHAAGSKRLGPGDAIVLFDGRGSVAEAELGYERARDGSLEVRVARMLAPVWSGRRVHLVCALPKGDRLSTLIDMTTQLGVASFAPLRCERSVVSETDARADRIRRIQIEACKQARWPWVPELRDEVTPRDIAQCPGGGRGAVVVAHPGGEPAASLAASLAASPQPPGVDCTVCVGPEGGFSTDEIAALRSADARTMDLGASLLRIETAAIVAVAFLRG